MATGRKDEAQVAKAEGKTGGKQPERYDEVVGRLEAVVKQLETGELSLEDSLKAFEEGIGLVRRGERLLADAEARIEQLLSKDGELQAVPLQTPGSATPEPAPPRTTAPGADDDDVPF